MVADRGCRVSGNPLQIQLSHCSSSLASQWWVHPLHVANWSHFMIALVESEQLVYTIGPMIH